MFCFRFPDPSFSEEDLEGNVLGEDEDDFAHFLWGWEEVDESHISNHIHNE